MSTDRTRLLAAVLAALAGPTAALALVAPLLRLQTQLWGSAAQGGYVYREEATGWSGRAVSETGTLLLADVSVVRFGVVLLPAALLLLPAVLAPAVPRLRAWAPPAALLGAAVVVTTVCTALLHVQAARANGELRSADSDLVIRVVLGTGGWLLVVAGATALGCLVTALRLLGTAPPPARPADAPAVPVPGDADLPVPGDADLLVSGDDPAPEDRPQPPAEPHHGLPAAPAAVPAGGPSHGDYSRPPGA